MSKELFKLLLDNNFYQENKEKISDKLFPDKLLSVYKSLQELHETYERDITLLELWEKYKVDHPTMTPSTKRELGELFNTLRQMEDIGPDIGEEILTKVWVDQLETEAADILLAGGDISEVKNIIERIESGNPLGNNTNYVTTDVYEMLEQVEAKEGLTWNLPCLQDAMGNIPGDQGVLGIVAARPDAGKTGFYVSLVYGQEGWLDQGAKVHVICNEEPAIRTQVRGLGCWTGKTKDELLGNKDLAKELFEPIKHNIFVQDKVNMSIEELDTYVSKHDVDVLVIDQLDKLSVRGMFNRSDEKLRVLYTSAREISKKYNCLVLAITQAGAGASGKMHYGFDDLDGSKTGKAAEADFVFCIGMKDPKDTGGIDDYLRCINIPKNKLSGFKQPVFYTLEPQYSRMRS